MAVRQRQSISTRLREMVKANPVSMKLSESEIILPTDEQANFNQTIQTHTNATVAPSGGTSDSTWIDCDGFDKIALTLSNSAATTSFAHIHWSNDGTNAHGQDTKILPDSTDQNRAIETSVKARYARIRAVNMDTTPRTMNVWAYLKA